MVRFFCAAGGRKRLKKSFSAVDNFRIRQVTAENIQRGAGTCFAPGTARDPLRHAGLRRDKVYR